MSAFQSAWVAPEVRRGASADVLQAIDVRMAEVGTLLTHATDRQAVDAAQAALDEVDLLLETAASDEGIDPSPARLLKALRDDLGGHVLAASALEAINMPIDTVADVLRRAVAAATSELAGLIPE